MGSFGSLQNGDHVPPIKDTNLAASAADVVGAVTLSISAIIPRGTIQTIIHTKIVVGIAYKQV